MFIINNDKSIYITRGDAARFTVSAERDGVPYEFQPNDLVRIKVFEKKGCDCVVLQKDFFIEAACDTIDIVLQREDTKIGDIIHKPKDYWYEIELNPETYPQTIVGYDEEGAKVFRLMPEGKDREPGEEEEAEGASVYALVLEIVGEMRDQSTATAASAAAAEKSAAAAEKSAAAAEATAQSVREDADDGKFDGVTPTVGENGNWFYRGVDSGVSAKGYQIGDIVETVKDELGESWLPCDGRVIPEGEYPELREVLPYNTEWRPMASYADFGTSGSNKYNSIRPLPVTGQWFFHLPFSRYNHISTGQEAAVYDAVTDTLIEFNCPTVPVAVNAYGIFGMTHDGDKYILGVYEVNSDGAADDKVHLFTSTDLEGWTLAYSATMGSTGTSGYSPSIYEANGMSFDGTNIVIMSERTLTSSGTTYYYYKIFTVGKEMTAHNEIREYSTEGITHSLVQTPAGYWAARENEGECVNVYGAGSGTRLFYTSSAYHHDKIAFYSDRYWIGLPADGEVSSHVYAHDLTTYTAAALAVTSIAGDQYACMTGAEYDRNKNEWTLYLKSTAQGKCWAARISADANPTEAANYICERIQALPENLSYEQMKPDRSQIVNAANTNRALRDPNLKCLPTHDEETNEFIYARSAPDGSGSDSVPGIKMYHDGEGNVTMEVVYGN